MQCVTSTNLAEYPLVSRGKVRDIYATGPDSLLIVTTDRISAFDVVMDDPIPHKGVVLNQITLFWMEKFAKLVPNHLLAADVKDFPKPLQAHADLLEGRAVLVRRAKPLPIECIVRGYITGSGWKDYQKTGQVSGHTLPKGLHESDKLEKPLFTP
ncbi:MAG: phosphoribosylaminoimidazolesuccinocarboxamide synthase, partial [Humidesulfovibrio sp.]|nr:phosphoribosylaminoimidazolesuccinocarboxamide synthase [Humidesulfovibrio sp.]